MVLESKELQDLAAHWLHHASRVGSSIQSDSFGGTGGGGALESGIPDHEDFPQSETLNPKPLNPDPDHTKLKPLEAR